MVVETLDAIEFRLLGHAVDGAAYNAGEVGAVPVAVGGCVDERLDVLGAAAELLRDLVCDGAEGGRRAYGVRGIDASVNNVRACSFTGAVVVYVRCRTSLAVRDAG